MRMAAKGVRSAYARLAKIFFARPRHESELKEVPLNPQATDLQ
jgi:hypothetical protein